MRTALGILAGAITALLYKNSLDTPFLFDDREGILLNPTLAGAFDPVALLSHNLARPVVNLSYGFDRWLWGLSAFGFHVTNALIHLAVVGLLYGWCTRALSDELSRTRHAGTTGPEWPAFFCAAIFAAHPVIAATVVYASGRSELLCALGALATLTFARRAITTANVRAGIIAVLFGVLAVGANSSAAALPVLVLAYDAWVLRDDGWRRRMWRVYLPATVLVGIAAAWQAAAALAAVRVPERGLAGNLLTEAIVIWRYVALLSWPHGQALVHQVRWITGAWDGAGVAALALLAGAAAGAFAIRSSRPLAAFGVLWFVAVLLPTSSIFPVRDAMAERRLYLAAPGLLLACASALATPLARRRAARAVATIALVILVVQTYTRNRLWADPMTLWQEAVLRSPEAWQAHLGYADLLRDLHRCDGARREYAEVLRLYPDQPAATAGLERCR